MAPALFDLFRFRPGVSMGTFGTANRILSSGGEQIFFANGDPLAFSTGRPDGTGGDGQQASHWKDNLGIGLMDPTAGSGEYADITDLDVMAFDVIGWDVAMDYGDALDTGAGTGTGNYRTSLADDGPRHYLFDASGLISDPAGAPKVFPRRTRDSSVKL